MAGGGLMIEVAGGIIGDEKGENWNLSSKGIISANAELYPEFVELIRG